ncbi:MAG: hypothetical protein KAY37_09255, partial [Phycisphaerae bacterium]|nr:hypothetical protein [Phycisphaerae bacterium]
THFPDAHPAGATRTLHGYCNGLVTGMIREVLIHAEQMAGVAAAGGARRLEGYVAWNRISRIARGGRFSQVR